jgi:heptosyltransferase-2
MLGDVLTSSVLIEPLKQRFPDAIIDYLIDKPALQVMQGNPFVNHYIIPDDDFKKSSKSVFKMAMTLRKANYDIVIDVYGKMRSQMITAFSGARYKIGWTKSYSTLIYNHSISRSYHSQYGMSLAVENRLKLLEPLEIPITLEFPYIYLDPAEQKAALEKLTAYDINTDKSIYMISLLGSSDKKTYPMDYMVQLVDYICLLHPEAQLLFNYLPSQKDDAKHVHERLKENSKKQVCFDLYASSLREFLAITSYCTAMIGNEGGAVNMAKSLNVKSFVIFAPYLKKENWFGSSEQKHTAVHLADYVSFEDDDYTKSKKKPDSYYRSFEPNLIFPALRKFLETS